MERRLLKYHTQQKLWAESEKYHREVSFAVIDIFIKFFKLIEAKHVKLS